MSSSRKCPIATSCGMCVTRLVRKDRGACPRFLASVDAPVFQRRIRSSKGSKLFSPLFGLQYLQLKVLRAPSLHLLARSPGRFYMCVTGHTVGEVIRVLTVLLMTLRGLVASLSARFCHRTVLLVTPSHRELFHLRSGGSESRSLMNAFSLYSDASRFLRLNVPSASVIVMKPASSSSRSALAACDGLRLRRAPRMARRQSDAAIVGTVVSSRQLHIRAASHQGEVVPALRVEHIPIRNIAKGETLR